MKVDRLGAKLAQNLALNWGEAKDERVTENREFLNNYFSDLVWSIHQHGWNLGNHRTTQRIVFLCFYHSFDIVVDRLLECSSTSSSLQGVVVVSLPYVDPISCALGGTDSALENVTRNAFCSYLRLFLLETPSYSLPSKSTSKTETVLEWRELNKDYGLVRLHEGENVWYVGKVVQGSKRKRKQKREYFGNVVNRLDNYGCRCCRVCLTG